MPEEELPTIDLTAALLSALAHPIRLRIVAEAMQRPSCVSTLARDLGVSRRSIYQHLPPLATAGIIDSRLGLGQDGRARRLVVPTAALTVIDRELIARAATTRAPTDAA